MQKGKPLNLKCTKCGDEEFQLVRTITITGGREVDWESHKAHDWGQARLWVNCQLCQHGYYVQRKQKS